MISGDIIHYEYLPNVIIAPTFQSHIWMYIAKSRTFVHVAGLRNVTRPFIDPRVGHIRVQTERNISILYPTNAVIAEGTASSGNDIITKNFWLEKDDVLHMKVFGEVADEVGAFIQYQGALEKISDGDL